MRIKEASEASGCNAETIRYYERIGLMPPPPRYGTGYRDYSEGDVRRLRFISRGRDLGFSLDEIRSLLKLAEDPELSCAEVDRLARHHLEEVRMRQQELRRIANELRKTIEGCAGGRRAKCAILAAMSDGETTRAVRRRKRVEVHG